MRRILKWSVVAVLVVLTGSVIAFIISFPSIAAVACPGCYGFEEIEERLFVGRDMTLNDRQQLRSDFAVARDTVATALEPTDARPFIFACTTDACDRGIGGKGTDGAIAEAHNTLWFSSIRFGPTGLNQTIITHELVHITFLEIVGAKAVIEGLLPAWLNEGVAVLISNDRRYLRPGISDSERCMEEPDGPLPRTPFEWGRAAGQDHSLYAKAACETLHWLSANGDMEGLIDSLRKTAATGAPVAER